MEEELQVALADLAAHTLALKALMATHPDLSKARAQFRVLLAEFEAEHLDRSFAVNAPTQETGDAIRRVLARAEQLLP